MTKTTSTQIIAHRGASSIAPENTVASIAAALEFHPDFIEIDVRLTKDKKLVVLHDASLKRTTGLRSKVHNLTLEEIKLLDAGKWFDKRFMEERVPTLEEVLHAIGSKAGLMIEIKQGVDAPHVAVDAVFDVLAQFSGKLPKLVIGGFSLETVKCVKKHLNRMQKSGMGNNDIQVIGIAERYSCLYPFIEQDVDILAAWYPLLTTEVGGELRQYIKQLWTFTVNTQSLASDLISSGVTGIITNYPQLF